MISIIIFYSFFELTVKGGEKTKSGKILIIILILFSVLVCLSSVAAQDSNSMDLSIQDTTSDEISSLSENLEEDVSELSVDFDDSRNSTVNVSTTKKANSDDKLAASNNEDALSVSPSGNTFLDIFTAITIAGSGGVVELEKTTYVGLNPIEISKSVTINGNGAILDARGIPVILDIWSDNVTINNITFINCRALIDGGAIDWRGKNGMLVNCNFINNRAILGGAVYWKGSHGKIVNCSFTGNNALVGAAVYWTGDYGNLAGCNFTGNNTAEGGTVCWYGDYGSLSGCDFTGNNAIYGGAVYWTGDYGNLTGCNFTGNNAINGGAVYWAYFASNCNLIGCDFTGNNASEGGAIYHDGENTIIKNAYFNNNNATRGSAIYNSMDSRGFKIADSLFERNQAQSDSIEIEIEGNESLEKANVSIKISFVGKDNIANAIWNDAAINEIQLRNISCEFSLDGKGRKLKRFNEDAYASPTADAYGNDDKLWQSPYEDAQLIDVLIKDNNNEVIFNLTSGNIEKGNNNAILSALPDDTGLNVTKVDGSITIKFENIEAGRYAVDAKHEDDAYYTYAESSDDFVIYEFNVTKTANSSSANVGENVTFTITVTNLVPYNLTNVNIADVLDNAFEFDGASTSVPCIVSGDKLVWNIGDLANGTSKTVTFNVTAISVGNITNIAEVNCSQSASGKQGKTNVYVVPIIKKSVNATEIYANQSVEYTISIDCRGAESVQVRDVLNESFVLDESSISADWEYNKTNGVFTYKQADVPANLTLSYTVKIVEPGNYTNVAVLVIPGVTAEALVVHVHPIIATNISLSNVTCYVGDDAILQINVTADYGYLFNDNITVVLPDGRNQTVEIINGVGNATWHVPEDYVPGEYPYLAVYEGNSPYLPSDGEGFVTVNPKVNLTVVKTSNVTNVANNTLVKFTINVTNHGPSNATKVEVSDLLPQGLTYVEAGAVDVDGQYAVFDSVDLLIPIGNGQFVTFVESNSSEDRDFAQWSISKITKGTTVVLWITARTNAIVMGNITNEVTVKYSENETDSIVNSTDINVVPVVLTVNKTANATKVRNNTLVEFTIIVNNTGVADATDVYVRDGLPDGFAFVSATEGYDEYWSSWSIDCIPAGNSIKLTIVGRSCEIGNWTNYAYAIPNENDTLFNDTFKVEVIQYNLTVVKSANDSDVSVGDLVEFTINVTNDGLIKATDINVTDLLDSAFEVQSIGNEEYIIFKDGKKIIWNIPSLDVDESMTLSLVVKLLFEGTFNNTAAVQTLYSDETSSTVNVTASKIPTQISVENVTVYPGKNVAIQINVTADDNKAFSGNVTIQFPDGSIQTVDITNGNGNVEWFVLENYVPGVYYDTVSYIGDDTYLASAGNGTITVKSVPTTVVVENVTAKAGQNVTIGVNVTSDDDKPFNGEVTVSLPDGSNQTVEIVDGSGEFAWSIPDDYDGNYPYAVQYPGDDKYLPSNATGTINVIPKSSIEIVVSNVTTYPDADVTITIDVLTVDGSLFSGEVTLILPDGSTQTVEIGDGALSTVLKLSHGDLLAVSSIINTATGSASWHVPASYAPGNYSVSVKFDGNEEFFAAEGTGNIEVIQIPTNISVSADVSGIAGQDVTIPINVTSDDDKPFNGEVTVSLPDGSNQTVEIVDGSGEFAWSIPDDYEGNYTYTVLYPGDDKYLPSNATGTINVVQKVPVDIIVENVTVHPGDKVTIHIKVVPQDGSVFDGEVTVELPDGTKVVVKIVSGEGSVEWTIPADYEGKYNIKVSFNDSDKYYPANYTGNGIGVLTVVPEVVPPANETNETSVKHVDIKADENTTGNPILALLAVLALLGINTKRRK